jgi:prefoldin subunit 5
MQHLSQLDHCMQRTTQLGAMATQAESSPAASEEVGAPQSPPGPHTSIRYNLCSSSNEQKTIPVLDFVEDIEVFLVKQGISDRADDVIEELNRLHKGLKIHQQKVYSERGNIQRVLPDLRENIKMIKALRQQERTNLRFMAADSVWVDGVVEQSKDGSESKIGLWLGANVMMEYTYDEADAVLTKSVAQSEAVVDSKTKELLFLKQQTTMCEVTVARFYNYEVARKRRIRVAEDKSKLT